MKNYWQSLAAYLTGWVIAQSIFMRVWRYVMEEQREESFQAMVHDMAVAVAEELSRTITWVAEEEPAERPQPPLRLRGTEQ